MEKMTSRKMSEILGRKMSEILRSENVLRQVYMAGIYEQPNGEPNVSPEVNQMLVIACSRCPSDSSPYPVFQENLERLDSQNEHL